MYGFITTYCTWFEDNGRTHPWEREGGRERERERERG